MFLNQFIPRVQLSEIPAREQNQQETHEEGEKYDPQPHHPSPRTARHFVFKTPPFCFQDSAILFSGRRYFVFRTPPSCFQAAAILFSGLRYVFFRTPLFCFQDAAILFTGRRHFVFRTPPICFQDPAILFSRRRRSKSVLMSGGFLRLFL